MADHYNAFISYRHAEADIRVAEAIEKGLEQFHVPGKIRQKTGIKRINRIFRDKDELPLTSDLTAEISNALENSDYLIVICSTNTRESLWVPREIEFFLRNHTRKQILTVLVDGEPTDTIPEVLLSEKKTVKDLYGNEQEIEVPIEPLSCDYRMPPKKAKKEELPRLASSLLGCSYAELMNRRRQYKIRQLSIIFSAMLLVAIGFGAYMFYSRKTIIESRKALVESNEKLLQSQQELLESREKIKENYNTALRNQSRYLANESKRIMDEDLRTTALLIALESMPAEGKSGVVTPEAIKALNEATYAYQTTFGFDMNPIWNYSLPNTIQSFKVSYDGKHLAALDEYGTLVVWDTKKHQEELRLTSESMYWTGYSFTNDSFILWCYDSIAAYDISDFSLRYELHLDHSVHNLIYDYDNKNIILIGMASDPDPFSIKDYMIIKWLDEITGQEIKTKLIDDNNNSCYLNTAKLSPDKKKIAFYASTLDFTDRYYMVYDSETDSITRTDNIGKTSACLGWTPDGNLLAAIYQDDYQMYSFLNETYLKTDHIKISCLDVNTFEPLWSYDFSTNDISQGCKFYNLEASNSILFYCGNRAVTLDEKTGKMLYDHNTNDTIVHVDDNNNDGLPMYITSNGGIIYPSTSTSNNALVQKYNLISSVSSADVCSGIFVLRKNGKDVIQYDLNTTDDSFNKTSGIQPLKALPTSTYVAGDVLLIYQSSIEVPELDVIDIRSNNLLYSITFSLPEDTDISFLSSDYDKVYMYYVNNDTIFLRTLNIPTGKYEDKAIAKDLKHFIYPTMNDSIITSYSLSKDDKAYILIYDVTTDTARTIDIPEDLGKPSSSPEYEPLTKTVLYRDDKGSYLLSDSGKVPVIIDFPDDWTANYNFVSGYTEDELAAFNDKAIHVFNSSGTVTASINTPGRSPVGMSFCHTSSDDIILVTYNDGSLYRYSLAGEFIGRTDISVYANAPNNHTYEFDYTDSLLYIHFSYMTDIIDMNGWIEIANIQNVLGYSNEADIFYCYEYNNDSLFTIGCFKRYTTEDLIKKSLGILNGTTLSDDIKSMYGITDN